MIAAELEKTSVIGDWIRSLGPLFGIVRRRDSGHQGKRQGAHDGVGRTPKASMRTGRTMRIPHSDAGYAALLPTSGPEKL